MTDRDIGRTIQSQLGSLFACDQHGDYLRIRTPCLYPDGDSIDLFCQCDGETVTVSDLGETTGWLWMQGLASRRTARQNALIEDACVTHGIEFQRGRLQARCPLGDNAASVVLRVAQAALRVSDLWVTNRWGGVVPIETEVAEYLSENRMAFDRARTLQGRSARMWKIDFQVHAAEQSSLVNVLSTANRAAARRAADHVTAGWFDLRHHLASGQAIGQFVTLFDDASDVWSSEDIRLAEDLSIVAFWSRPDEFAAILAGTA